MSAEYQDRIWVIGQVAFKHPRNGGAEYVRVRTTPSAAAMRAAEEISDALLSGAITENQIGAIAEIITRNLAGTTSPEIPELNVTPEQIVYNVAQRDPRFRKHLIEQLTAMGDEQDTGPLRTLAPVPDAGDDVGEQPIAQLIAKEIADIYGLGHQRSGLTTVISKYLVAVSTSTPILQPDELNDLCETLEMAAGDLDTEGLGDTDSCIFARKWAARLRGERQ